MVRRRKWDGSIHFEVSTNSTAFTKEEADFIKLQFESHPMNADLTFVIQTVEPETQEPQS